MNGRIDLLVAETSTEDSGARELEQLLDQPVDHAQQPMRRHRIDGVIIGTLIGFRDASEPLVVFPDQPGTSALSARASVDLFVEHIGDSVTLAFENGDPTKPIVIGRVRIPATWPTTSQPTQVEVESDGKRVTISAEDTLILRCGDASITLTAAGKVLIRGVYVSSRSSGLMRINGAAVHIN